ncbi:MAG: HNH endonuclease [Anaerolineae bacterium]|nr:HNH endonuclease [Anaerolineae bacterium]
MAEAHYRCGYCLSPQHLVMAALEIEHIIPLSRGGSDDEINLWIACPLCNRHKGQQIEANDPLSGTLQSLFNPRLQSWSEHFEWDDSGIRIYGKTPVGRATVIALKLNDDPRSLAVRLHWVQAGWHPPKDK